MRRYLTMGFLFALFSLFPLSASALPAYIAEIGRDVKVGTLQNETINKTDLCLVPSFFPKNNF